VLCYTLYALVLYACYQGFWLWRSTVERVLPLVLPMLLPTAMQQDEWFPPIYLAATALMGLVIFCVVVAGENHLRAVLTTSYYPQGSYALRLFWRFVHVGLVLAVLIGVAAGLQEWAFRAVA
jgi:hypothetical protein